MKVAVVGATGLVGGMMLKVLEERNFPVTELIPVATEKSVGKEVLFKSTKYKVQSIKKAVEQLMNERKGIQGEMAYKYAIDLNVLPQIDVFLENGYTKEEMKMVNETRKILRDDSIRITATTVRVPVKGGHSEAVNVEFEKDFDINDVRKILSDAKGVVVIDEPSQQKYPMPIDAEGKDEVFVGRIRRDESQTNSL